MKRGDLVSVALQGDVGKPRPAMIVQADLFEAHPTVVVLPLTSHLEATPIFRVTVEPSATNGLKSVSQVMIDKPHVVRREKVGAVFGRIDADTLIAVNRALTVFLGMA